MDLLDLGVLGTIASILFGYFGYMKGKKDEQYKVKQTYKQEGQHEGTLRTDIEYIKRRSDDMLLEQKETNKNMNALTERLTRVEENVKHAHSRIDGLTDGRVR